MAAQSRERRGARIAHEHGPRGRTRPGTPSIVHGAETGDGPGYFCIT